MTFSRARFAPVATLLVTLIAASLPGGCTNAAPVAEEADAVSPRWPFWPWVGWSNWAGNVRCWPARYERPTTLAGVQAAVRSATHVRPVGAGHSWSALACSDDLMLDTTRLDRVLAVDRAAGTATVEAGIKLVDLDRELDRRGLALRTEPTIAEITAGGAIATSSHGTGLGTAALADEVLALQLVDAAGNLVTIADADRLRAARVSLGALGVIYAITFRVVPAFNLEITEEVVDEADALPQIDALVHAHAHVDLFWFPTEKKVFRRVYDPTDKPVRVSHPLLDWFEEWVVRTWVARFGLDFVSWLAPDLVAALNFVEPFTFRTQTDVDRSDRIFHRFPGHQKIYSMEYLIPLARTQEAIAAIRAALAASSFYPNTPIYLRFPGGGSDGDLSPLGAGPVAAIEVLSYVRFGGWEAFFRDLEPRWRALGGRPHWGKLFYGNPAPLYDAAARAHFKSVRAQLDPNGKFGNPLVDELLGVP